MKKEERKHRLALTVLMSVVIFVVQLFAVAIAAGIVYLLVYTGVLTEYKQEKEMLQQIIFFMALLSSILGAIAATVTSKLYLGPINKLITQINRLASGDFKARLSFGKSINGHPSFREITTSFNKMAEELEGTEMLRSDFINNFSHEFKTPIVSISGFAKLLKHGDLTPEQQREYLDIIEAESLRLASMATNVLDMTKVENQMILTDVTKFNLSEQIRGCVLLLLEGKWAKKEIDFSIEFDEHMIMGNQELLEHVWINLLDNAIKFSPEGGTVEVDIQKRPDALAVTVSNTGTTIPKELLGKIFVKFYQVDESHSTEGNGIGLALVKRITELHEGSVTANSENGRTTFTVVLPQ